MGVVKDVKSTWIEDDIEKIQVKTNFYISETNSEAEFHKFREVAQNAIDECNDTDSNGDYIDIIYDCDSKICTVKDNGRGFPETDIGLDIYCTKIQSGSKFNRIAGSNTAGEMGSGITAVNALSDYFEIINNREQERTSHDLVFEFGKNKKNKVNKNASGEHGAIIKWSNSTKYLGDNAYLDWKKAYTWFNKNFYFPMDNPKLKAKFTVIENGEIIFKEKVKQKPFTDLFRSTFPSMIVPDIYITGNDTIIERIDNEDVVKSVRIDLSVSYTQVSDTIIDSYCNYTNTIDGGVHVDAFTKTYCNYMQSKVKATMSESQREKTPILWEDVKNGLCAIISLLSNAQVSFDGNAKVKIVNERLIPIISGIIQEKLDEFFSKNPSIFDKYVNIIKLNAKARIEASNVRNAVKVEKVDKLKEFEFKNFIPCNNKVGEWRELFIVEGGSASSGVRNACNPDTDAILLLRGVTKNPFKCSMSELMENAEMKMLVTVMGCGIGKSFDINKLRFDRINIFTDQDIDGFGISAGLLGFFYLYYRDLIKAGKIFKVFTPLYHIDDKDNPFVANKMEMIELYHKKLIKNYKIEAFGRELSKSEMKDFLSDTYDYREDLIRVAKNRGKTNKFLLECVLANYTLLGGDKNSGSEKFNKALLKEIQKRYKETKMTDDNTIVGVADKKYCMIKISKRLFNLSENLIAAYKEYGYMLKVTEKDLDPVYMSIGEFLDNCTKYYAKIVKRYKGLGEINEEDLQMYAMDFSHRVSVQYTVKSAEKEIETFYKLLSSKKHYPEDRKKMMSAYKIKREDLDN